MEEWPRHQVNIPLGDPVVLHSNGFYTALGSIFDELPNQAALALRVSNPYAVKQENATSNVTLYGLAQCTPDLAAGDCKRCIADAAAEFAVSCCGGSIGASVLFPSCIVRYETYPFYQHSGTSAPTTIKGKFVFFCFSNENVRFFGLKDDRERKVLGERLKANETN